MKRTGRILMGGALIIIGALVILNVLGVLTFDLFFDGWWTLFLIVPSLIGLVTEREKTGSLFFLLLGVLLLLASQKVIPFDWLWKLLLPTALILIGLRLIIGHPFDRKQEGSFAETTVTDAGYVEKSATFSGRKLTWNHTAFEGAKLSAVFGGLTCDLTEAIFEKDITIKAVATFGGITLVLPDTVNVKVSSHAAFGGVSQKKMFNSNAAVTVFVEADCSFGGVEIQ